MRIFLSWSGDVSRDAAEVFRAWLPSVLQFVRPYFTPSDVEKGARWESEIAKELQASSMGLLFLTRDNLQRPWLLFEAGALSKAIDKSRVCPILLGINSSDLSGPLTHFQAAQLDKDEIKKLVADMNRQAGDTKLADQVLDNVFDKWWPDLENSISKVLSKGATKKDAERVRSDRQVLEEILTLCRSIPSVAPSTSSPMSVERLEQYEQMVVKFDVLIGTLESKVFDVEALREIETLGGAILDFIARTRGLPTALRRVLQSSVSRLSKHIKEIDDIPF